MNLRMLQQQNEQNDVAILVILWSLSLELALQLYLSPNNHEYPMVYMKLCTLLACISMQVHILTLIRTKTRQFVL